MVAMPPAKRRTGLHPLAYMGVEPISPLQFVINPRDPTINDINFNIGTIWLNNLNQDPWILVNLDRSIATWLRLGTAGAGDLDSLTGNTGGPVFPDVAQNIDVVADGNSGMTITGNPGANSLTIFTVTGNPVGQSITGDVGAAAIFDGNSNIDVLGGANINTVTPGTGSEVFIHLNDVIRWPGTNAGGTEGVIYLNGTSGAGGDRFMHNGGTAITNTFLGIDSGNFVNTGGNNTGIGFNSLENITSAIGNSSFGRESLSQLLTGTDNSAVGAFAGSNYTGAESDNICIDNDGTVGESNTIRIGTEGTQTRSFMAGVTGVSVSTPVSVVIDPATGQLGVGGSSGNA